MATPLVPNDLWAAIEPLLPLEPARPKGGRPRVSGHVALAGILFVLRMGIQLWNVLAEVSCSGKTCLRRLVEWHADGVWAALHGVLLERLREADRLDWRRASLDNAAVRAQRGGAETGPSPTDRGKAGTKRHLVADATARRSV